MIFGPDYSQTRNFNWLVLGLPGELETVKYTNKKLRSRSFHSYEITNMILMYRDTFIH